VPRVASVIADGECLLLEVPRELLRELSARHRGLEQLLQRFYKERLLANLLRSNDLFSVFSQEARERLVDREGAVFGEISLLELCLTTATVRAETAAVLLFLDRTGFAEEVLRNPAAAKKLDAIARVRLERSAALLDDGGILPSMI
jgi:CRP-like cAMP-binding protein